MRIIKFLIVLSLSLSFVGCEKTEEIHNTEDKVGISRVTRFPVFTMNGDRYLSIVQGGTFSDPGVTAKEGSTDLTVQTSGSVNVNEPGVYDITYSATNKDNFSASVTRTIAVLPAAEQAGVDISGKYEYVSNPSYVATVKKLAPGFYTADNVWGPNDIPSYILTINGTDLLLPVNALSGYGPVQGTGTLDAAGNLTYKVDLLAYGITGVTRKWKKQ